MSSAFHGIETALRGVLAHQQAISTVAHNVANASTEGYSRQDPVFQATNAFPAPSFAGYPDGGPFGTGVEIGRVRRLHDTWLAGRLRTTESTYQFWEMQRQFTDRIEQIVSQSGGAGLNVLMDRFWNAWQQLTQGENATDTGIRAVIVSEGRNLAAAINSMNHDLAQLSRDARSMLEDAVARVNDLAKGLADLNAQVRVAGGLGGTPNDLFDQRDRLLAELSSLVDIDVYEGQHGSVTVTLGSRQLVEGTFAGALQVAPGTPAVVQWSDGTAASVTQGQVAALLRVENDVIPGQQAQLDALRTALVDSVNSIHSTGFDLDGNSGLPFFQVSGSDKTLSVTPALDDPRRLAASGDGSAGNAEIARAIADIRDTPQLLLGQVSIREHLSAWLSRAGAEAREMQDMSSRTLARRDAIRLEQESVSGVNLDEEAARLVQWQRAYMASARVLTALDEVLAIVIERMGVVGR